MCLFRWHCLSIKYHRYQWCRNITPLWPCCNLIHLRKFAQHVNANAAPGPKEGKGGGRSATSLSCLIQLFATTWLLGCWLCLPELSLTSGLPALEWGERLQSLSTSFSTPTLRVKGNSKKPCPGKKWCLHVMCLKDPQWHCYLSSTANKLATLL